MNRTQWRMALSVGFTFMGTIVGAGFASGQEILTFFTRFGKASYAAIALAMVLFGVVGSRILVLGAALDGRSSRSLTLHLLGPRIAPAVDAAMGLMLFGVTVAMLAGAGALFEERLRLPFSLGVIVTAVLCYLTVLFGLGGIMKANDIIVPLMMLTSAWISFHHFGPRSIPFDLIPLSPWSSASSAVSYAAFNIGLSSSVFIPLGRQIRDPRVLRAGAWIGAVGMGVMLLCANAALSRYWPGIADLELPMGRLASELHPGVHALFIAVLWGEIYSTLIANVFGLIHLVQDLGRRIHPGTIAVLLLVAAFFVSRIGFSNLVHALYPFFGYVSLLLLFLLLWPRRLPHS
ncbi:MAG: hypothetical protein IMX06_10090 [Kyrpidia tusciae]|nr:hypothetical protein [Kyrpidia tusciae]MBE3553194.1 hypothetical protein [Kyrpidia tusciae]